MFEKIIEEWLNHKIGPLKNLVEGINGAAEIYGYIENSLHIPSPYSTAFLIAVILGIAIVLFLVIGWVLIGAENSSRIKKRK